MPEVHIIAIFYPRDGKLKRMEEVLAKMCADVHAKEEGALRYMMTEEIGTKSPTVVMIETYKDEKVQAEHANTEHFKALVATLQKEDLQEKPFYLARTVNKAGFDVDRKLMESKI